MAAPISQLRKLTCRNFSNPIWFGWKVVNYECAAYERILPVLDTSYLLSNVTSQAESSCARTMPGSLRKGGGDKAHVVLCRVLWTRTSIIQLPTKTRVSTKKMWGCRNFRAGVWFPVNFPLKLEGRDMDRYSIILQRGARLQLYIFHFYQRFVAKQMLLCLIFFS